MSSDENTVNDDPGSGSVPPFPGGQNPAQPEPQQPPAPQVQGASQVPPPAAPQLPSQPPVPSQPQSPTAPQVPAAPQSPAAPSYGQQPPAQPTAAPSYGQQPPAPSQQPASPYQQQPAPYPPQAQASYAGQPQAQYPGQAQQAFQPPSQPPKRKLGVGVIIAIAGGSLVVLVAIIVAIAIGVSSMRGGGPVADPDKGGSGKSGGAASASESVVGYLTAIADADAKKALGYLGSEPDTTTALTDEVLEASKELAPITDIEVVDESGSSGTADVTVSYMLGSTPVEAKFGALDYDDDNVWEVTGGTASISTNSFAGLGLMINGQEIDEDFVDLFPGSYQLTLSQPNFAPSNGGTFTVTEPFASVDVYELRPTLSDAGLQAFRGLVRAAVDACVASTTLAAGCGIDLPATISDGTQLTDGTISRTLSAEQNAKIDSLTATPSFDVPTLVKGDFIGGPKVEADCIKNGTSGRCSVIFGSSLGAPSVDMAAENPTVTWE